MSDAIGLELERREKILHESLECGHDLVEEQPCAQCRLEARIEALEEALTPSAETKAAYWGEAGLTNDWTLIKAVMKAIRERALQEPTK